MRKIVSLLVVAAFAAGAVVLLKPGLAESVVPGLFAAKHKKAVRGRAAELVGYLYENELDKCVELTDPAFVRQHGVTNVKLRFGVVYLLAKAGKYTMDDVQLGEVRLSPDNQRAEIDMQLRINGEWQYQKPGKWVRVDDQWYCSPE